MQAFFAPNPNAFADFDEVLLTTVRRDSPLKSWGLKFIKRRGPKRARVAVARKLAALMGRIWKDGTHFDAVPA